jgi:RNA-directed DNA polymerase
MAHPASTEANLREANPLDLLERVKSGRYRASPVCRAYSHKVAQRAVTMKLDAVYEQKLLPCSPGFRPGRSRS